MKGILRSKHIKNDRSLQLPRKTRYFKIIIEMGIIWRFKFIPRNVEMCIPRNIQGTSAPRKRFNFRQERQNVMLPKVFLQSLI